MEREGARRAIDRPATRVPRRRQILYATMVAVLSASVLGARAAAAQVAQAASSNTPQTLADLEAAGIRMAFDVVSVKPSLDAPAESRFPLGPGDAFTAGNLFTAKSQPLVAYVRFAFKLGPVELPGLPGWVYDERFDIAARADGSPTKDQMRLMMQALLADRFKMVTHRETRTGRAFELVLEKAGQAGPQLREHSEQNGSCSTVTPPPASVAPATVRPPSPTSGLQLPPFPCGSIGQIPASAPGHGRIGGRDVTLSRLAGFLQNPFTGVDRPVVDGTGLTGTYDFSVEWVVPRDVPQDPNAPFEEVRPTFAQALQEQLGLSLKSTTAPIAGIVIDHIERPTPD